MERIIRLDPGYDKRDPDPNKNYGIGSVTLRMVLKGKAAFWREKAADVAAKLRLGDCNGKV